MSCTTYTIGCHRLVAVNKPAYEERRAAAEEKKEYKNKNSNRCSINGLKKNIDWAFNAFNTYYYTQAGNRYWISFT
jgi:hypothetical protein